MQSVRSASEGHGSHFKNFVFATLALLTIVSIGIMLGANERWQHVFDVLGGATMFVIMSKSRTARIEPRPRPWNDAD